MIKMTTGRATLGTILAVFGLLLSTSPLAAADSEMTQEYLTCMDKSNGNTAGMTDCISAETARQDARLNENYKRLMQKLSAKRKNALQAAQRAWVKFRDANCSFYFDPDGGTAALLDGRDCFLQATADRAKELKNLTR
jgi:uncharacterized protein YecT (DUF1311 family)